MLCAEKGFLAWPLAFPLTWWCPVCVHDSHTSTHAHAERVSSSIQAHRRVQWLIYWDTPKCPLPKGIILSWWGEETTVVGNKIHIKVYNLLWNRFKTELQKKKTVHFKSACYTNCCCIAYESYRTIISISITSLFLKKCMRHTQLVHSIFKMYFSSKCVEPVSGPEVQVLLYLEE